MKFKYLLIVFSLVFLISCAFIDRIEEDELFTGNRPDFYLKDNYYKSISIEVISVQGQTPFTSSLDFLVERMNQYCHKPAGITYSFTTVPMSAVGDLSKKSWDQSDLSKFRNKWKKTNTSGSNLVMYILSVPGGYHEDFDSVGGVSCDAYSFAIFNQVRGSQANIMLHEAGHVVFGLVGNGTPTTSKHKVNDGHCNNNQCIMYTPQINNFRPDFDEACKKDLRANGSK